MRPGRLSSILFVGSWGALACGGEGGENGGGTESGPDRTPVLQSVADRVVLPAIAEARTAFDGLVAAAEAARDQDDPSLLQNAWRQAASAWQPLEMMRFGPMGSVGGPSAGSPRGGLGIRSQVYSWPVLPASPCAIDQATVKDRDIFSDEGYFASKLPNVFGLGAVEYLAFVNASDNACASQVDINDPTDPDAWANFSPEQIADLRADFAVAQARHLAAQVERLDRAWNQEGFRAAFVGAGTDTSVYPTAQSAFDDIYAAMNQLDLWVKDDKLGIPLGIHAECLQMSCPDQAESPYADLGRRFIQVDVEAFQRLFLGGEPSDPDRHGFDTHLEAVGQGTLAQELVQRIDAMVASAQATEPPLRQALQTDVQVLTGLHARVNDVTRILKSQFVSVLALRVPQEGAADND